jgi:hypothetical protein
MRSNPIARQQYPFFLLLMPRLKIALCHPWNNLTGGIERSGAAPKAPELLQRMGANADAPVERHGWRQIVSRMDEMIESKIQPAAGLAAEAAGAFST